MQEEIQPFNIYIGKVGTGMAFMEMLKNTISICPVCQNPSKFKKIQPKKKVIIENGPHYRYIADLWQLPSTITKETGYKYIIDIVDHFSKWNYGCFSEMTPPYPPPISLENTPVTL